MFFNPKISRHRRLMLLTMLAVMASSIAQPPAAYASWFSELPIIRHFRRNPAPTAPATTNSFAWVNDTIDVKATEKYTGTTTALAARGPARDKARAAVLAKLQRKVENLKVSGGIKLGQLMRRNIAVSHAVETWIVQTARITYSESLTSDMQSNGIIATAQAVLELNSLVGVLQKQGVTPTGLPPVQPIPSVQTV